MIHPPQGRTYKRLKFTGSSILGDLQWSLHHPTTSHPFCDASAMCYMYILYLLYTYRVRSGRVTSLPTTMVFLLYGDPVLQKTLAWCMCSLAQVKSTAPLGFIMYRHNIMYPCFLQEHQESEETTKIRCWKQ